MEKHNEKVTGKDVMNKDCSILIEEVREKVQKLKENGMSEKEIVAHLRFCQPLPCLIISNKYDIFLGVNRQKLHMEPLVKAIYLLFLKHPEGIVFKALPDYRKELTHIYDKVKPWGLTDRSLQSIEDVTNPLLNSINEKCARIKKAFLDVMDNNMAEHYYIKGTRGEPKGISLPRKLVCWE